MHIADGPVNYIQSAHTVYSFHSQNLFDDEGKASPQLQRNGAVGGVPFGSSSMLGGSASGRVLRLQPVASVPNMQSRYVEVCDVITFKLLF